MRDKAPQIRQMLADLSLEALYHAARFASEDVGFLAARLYFYNREPASPAWRRLYASPDEVAAQLALATGGENARCLEGQWQLVSPDKPHERWFTWFRRSVAGRDPERRYKLYVSPWLEELPHVFTQVIGLIEASGAEAFKVGRDVYSLIRPDKLVLYFSSFEALDGAGQLLARELGAIRPQGVPFTAQLGGTGLVSWALDPPRALAPARGLSSWRHWVTHQLAASLATGMQADLPVEACVQFARDQLALRGVDTVMWAPDMDIWSEAKT